MRYLLPIGGIINHEFGILTAPNHKGVPVGIVEGMDWAADLGCLDGPEFVKRFDSKSVKWLKMMEPYKSKCLFISGLDCVGDAERTLRAFPEFCRLFAGWPLAFVAQDGQEDLPLPGGDWATLFIGGSTEWKDGPGAVEVILRAQAIGKRIHIGRVNEYRRYKKFYDLPGGENFTCDGTKNRFIGVENGIKYYATHKDRAQRQIHFSIPGSDSGG